jgi:RHS repeat-associated protein
MIASTLNGVRQALFDYDEATSRIVSMIPYDLPVPFEWSFIQGSYLKSELLYPCGLSAFWRYGINGQVECVRNGFPSNVVSRYDVTYDGCLRKRRVEMRGSAMDAVSEISFEYNNRGEVTDFYKKNLELPGRFEVSYRYDDSGNRTHINFSDLPTWYSHNETSQCTNKFSYGSSVSPTYDSDGNMTVQHTADGKMWSIVYDGENRPVLWRSAVTNLVMRYDSRGRRVSLSVVVDDVVVVRHVYVYNGYQCIVDYTSNGESICYLWDPTEPVAARPLFARRGNGQDLVYTHDCRKNVSEVVDVNTQSVMAHYEYDAFGEIGPIYPLQDRVRRGELRYINPWRWSCEYADDITGNVYYNYRHYSPVDGRWLSRDPVENDKASMPYIAADNDMVNKCDILGLSPLPGDAQLIAKAKSRCQSMLDGSKHIKNVLSGEQITPDAKRSCMSKVNAALGEQVVSDVVSEFGEGCEMPKLDCGCCSSFTMANSGEKRGVHGYWDPRIKTVMFCWNNYNDKEIKPFSLAKTIAHELTHSLQRCGRDGRGCLSSIKKEIEARMCAKQCGSFEECFLNALESSCFMGTHCNNASDAANYMPELRQWFMEMSNEQNSLGFCKFGFGNKAKVK